MTETKNTHKKARNAWLAQWILGILLLVKLGGKYRTGPAGKSAHTNACIYKLAALQVSCGHTTRILASRQVLASRTGLRWWWMPGPFVVPDVSCLEQS